MTLLRTLLLWLFLWPVLIFYYPLRWLWSKMRPAQIVIVPGEDHWVDVVGESSYYDNFVKLFGRHKNGVNVETTANLVLEKKSFFDPVRPVRVEIKGLTVGHLPRESAVVVGRIMAQSKKSHQVTDVPALVRGGWIEKNRNAHFGVKLNFQF